MPYKDPIKQKAYMRNYTKLQRKIVKNSNQKVRWCQFCGVLTIHVTNGSFSKCMKCEGVN